MPVQRPVAATRSIGSTGPAAASAGSSVPATAAAYGAGRRHGRIDAEESPPPFASNRCRIDAHRAGPSLSVQSAAMTDVGGRDEGARYETVRFAVDGPVATVVIDNPERRNALAWTTLAEMRHALGRARAAPAVRVVVVSGAGDRAFSAGADLSGMVGRTDHLARHDARGELGQLFEAMWSLGKPTIAKVRGYCLAGGFGVALACDMVVAATDAVFGTPEIDVGIWPMMITVPLLRSLPPKRALELMMTGRRVSAAEGERLGFVTRVVPPDELDGAVGELAATLASKPPAAMRLGRDAFYRVLDLDSAHALALLQSELTVLSATDDAAEGMAAFAEKRPPSWTGR
jgi:enoyl-CoA hydratase/carnithine racemase